MHAAKVPGRDEQYEQVCTVGVKERPTVFRFVFLAAGLAVEDVETYPAVT